MPVDGEPPPPTPEPAPEPQPEGQPRRYLTPEPGLPRGCNPLTFGVVMATLEMALFVGLWMRCH
jgi:hypothetical protein